MKHPFWIANSSLLFLVLLAFSFIYFSRMPLPERENIEPGTYVKPPEEVLQINISKVYENDLFNTYKKEVAAPERPDYTVPFPQPPKPQSVSVPEIPAPQFLDPLNITLKGIVVSNINAKNRAIIEDNNTKQETVYKVGSTIEDARIIRILNNKIILLRSSGQQEVLYIREKDAKSDPTYALIEDWNQVIVPSGENRFLVNSKEFALRVNNLGYFIDLLGLTTAYKQGVSIGCRIGQMHPTLGTQFGLQVGDIIVSINNIPATNTENRLAIYKEITNMRQNDTINVKLVRNNQESSISFVIKDSLVEQTGSDAERAMSEKLSYEDKVEVLKQKHKFAPTLQEIRKQEKQNMFRNGKAQKQVPTTNE
jgi:type II secretory pathway component PulC